MGHSTKRLTTADFISRAKEAHGDRYDYSQVVYSKSTEKVAISCPEHGLFEQRAHDHLAGCGCALCYHAAVGRRQLGSTAYFVDAAREVHGGRYDYSQVVYKGNKERVKIICLTHGPFEQNAWGHLSGKGCAACGGTAKLDTASFIAKAREIHGDRYDYSQAEYRNSREKVKIICPEHGPFEQSPTNHTSQKQGCFACGVAIRVSSTPHFIAKAREAHGDRYDYSQVVYKGIGTKVKIICPEHGLFEQRPHGHLSGKGCTKCGFLVTVDFVRLTPADFLARAREAHGDRYDYSQAVFLGTKEKVKIICPEHGLFEQEAGGHLSGRGCSLCGGTAKLDSASFVEAAREAHGDRYDYSQAEYQTNRDKIKIICPEHGLFEQSANSHMGGNGCPACGREKIREAIRLGWVANAASRPCTLYFLRVFNDLEEFYKIGITVHSVAHRYRAKESLAGYQYEVLALHKSTNAAAVWEWEQSILQTFAHLAYKPRLAFGGETECFLPEAADEILNIFPL